MKVYIAGAISALPPHVARNNFKLAEAYLFAQGHEVVNPMELPHAPNADWCECMALDISHLVTCDAVYALPNWRQSKGARIEVSLARHLGKQIIFAHAEAA